MTQRQDFNQFLMAIGTLGKVFPSIIQRINQPRAVDAILEQAVRVHRVPDRQAFLAPVPTAMPGVPGGMPVGAGPAAPPGIAGPPAVNPLLAALGQSGAPSAVLPM